MWTFKWGSLTASQKFSFYGSLFPFKLPNLWIHTPTQLLLSPYQSLLSFSSILSWKGRNVTSSEENVWPHSRGSASSLLAREGSFPMVVALPDSDERSHGSADSSLVQSYWTPMTQLKLGDSGLAQQVPKSGVFKLKALKATQVNSSWLYTWVECP